jgi:hypothetical protein
MSGNGFGALIASFAVRVSADVSPKVPDLDMSVIAMKALLNGQ